MWSVWAFGIACVAIVVLLVLLGMSGSKRARLDEELDTTYEDLAHVQAEVRSLGRDLTTVNAALFDSKRREETAAGVIREAEAKIATLQTQGEHLEADYQRTLGQLREAEAKASKVDYWKDQASEAREKLKRLEDTPAGNGAEAKAKTPRNAKDVAAK